MGKLYIKNSSIEAKKNSMLHHIIEDSVAHPTCHWVNTPTPHEFHELSLPASSFLSLSCAARDGEEYTARTWTTLLSQLANPSTRIGPNPLLRKPSCHDSIVGETFTTSDSGFSWKPKKKEWKETDTDLQSPNPAEHSGHFFISFIFLFLKKNPGI